MHILREDSLCFPDASVPPSPLTLTFPPLGIFAPQVMVDGLANSRWFQRFAIRTDKLMQEGAAEYQQKAQEFTKVFREVSGRARARHALGTTLREASISPPPRARNVLPMCSHSCRAAAHTHTHCSSSLTRTAGDEEGHGGCDTGDTQDEQAGRWGRHRGWRGGVAHAELTRRAHACTRDALFLTINYRAAPLRRAGLCTRDYARVCHILMALLRRPWRA